MIAVTWNRSFFLALCQIFWISGPNSQLILKISLHLVLFFDSTYYFLILPDFICKRLSKTRNCSRKTLESSGAHNFFPHFSWNNFSYANFSYYL